MSKEEDIKFLKIQTCILKVNIHCHGCKKKVKKLLHKVDGVYTTTIDSEQGKVTVSGDVDPAALIKKLAKAGKHAELLAPHGVNKNAKNNNVDRQAQKTQPQSGKVQQKVNEKVIAGGNGAGKDQKGRPPPPQQPQPTLQQQLQQMKGFKDMQVPPLKQFNFPPQKNPKSANFSSNPKRCDGFDEDDDEFDDDEDEDDEFDDDDDMDDEFDCFDADFDGDFKNIKIKPAISTPMKNGKAGGNCGSRCGGGSVKKGGGVPMKNKGGNGKMNSGGASAKNAGNVNKGFPVGHGSGHHGQAQAGKISARAAGIPGNGATKKMPGNNEVLGGAGGHPVMNPSMPGQVFSGRGAAARPAGNMHVPMGQMGNIPAAAAAAMQRPMTGAPPPGYFQGAMAAPPPPAATANAYQQQYMAAMMHQQQLQQQYQRMMMMNAQDRATAAAAAAGFQPMMGYPRPPAMPMYTSTATASPMAAPPQHGDPYTSIFSDENATSSCSIV